MLDNRGFDLWADGYDHSVGLSDEENTYPFAGYKDVLGSIFQIIMQKPNAMVLDLGFGTGTLTTKLYEHGCHIYGQDFSKSMIDLASEKMPEAQLYQGDLSTGLVEPLRHEAYDFIVATYSLHHLTKPKKISFINELLELLRDHGEILIGDIAFETQEDQQRCREMAGEEWDEEEIYFIIDELKQNFPQLRFQKASFCAGIIRIEK
ncbi:MAG: class I SAM-dependent methyltransferase [Eubacteriales bacterium]|nr:class I SAM-dependent methyltransferase [Eubacteriales bacterium]